MKLWHVDIRNVFQDLIAERISREDADRWAYARMQAFDSNDLSFRPRIDENLLWNAVQYLYGIDMKISSDEYIHSIDDIENEYLSRWAL